MGCHVLPSGAITENSTHMVIRSVMRCSTNLRMAGLLICFVPAILRMTCIGFSKKKHPRPIAPILRPE